jgi:hypothetical protein
VEYREEFKSKGREESIERKFSDRSRKKNGKKMG